jgi:hypothetical protein
MQSSDGHEDSGDQTPDTSITPGRLQSFVYPIRSLLGPVQPSRDTSVFDALLSRESDFLCYFDPPGSLCHSAPPVAVQTPASEVSELLSHPVHSLALRSSSDAVEQSAEPPMDAHSFRHYPAEETHRPLVTNRHLNYEDSETTDGAVKGIPHANLERQEGDGTTVIQETDFIAPDPMKSTSGTADTLTISINTANAGWKGAIVARDFVNKGVEETAEVNPRPSSADNSERNFGLTGLVHLPPVEKLDAQKRTREWRGRIGSPVHSSANSNTQNTSQKSKEVEAGEPLKENPKSSSLSVTTVSTDKSGPVVTTRFEHLEDENGHHILVGREGTLMRCEDEVSSLWWHEHSLTSHLQPIRTPGSVQGFGVLLVLHDDSNSGQLKVRQASEVW